MMKRKALYFLFICVIFFNHWNVHFDWALARLYGDFIRLVPTTLLGLNEKESCLMCLKFAVVFGKPGSLRA